jgi:phosphoglycolate phosphatase-like HAD superfamily hydrolase
MIGDRDSDVICGQKASVKTIMILNQNELQVKKTAASIPDFKATDLLEAVNIILRTK